MAVYLLRQAGCCFSLKLTICVWASFYISGSFSLLIINTTKWFNYTYLDDYEIYVRDIKSIVFMVKAANDAHIALSETLYKHTKNSYEIVIGGWGNQRSVIRKCDQCLPKSSLYHTTPLSGNEYRPFWISWEGGLLRLGNGTVPGEEELIEWEDPEPYSVNHMGISNGWGAHGSWIFDFPPPTWLPWSAWDQCNSTCGYSIRQRMRNCKEQQPTYDIKCWGAPVETIRCEVPNCPIDGSWSSWEAWGSCSRTCSAGIQSRQRNCDSPVPQFGGDICPGDYTQMRRCDHGSCPINGSWSTWTQWTYCSVSCGGGTQGRNRSCSNPTPQFGGLMCTGDSVESQTCSTDYCPINGGWATWTSWSVCSVTCGGGGTQVRTRICDNPAPQYGGWNCTGSSTESNACTATECPINGSWSSWTQWTSCSLTCGGGSQDRSRVCSNPAPQFGGLSCIGSSTESKACSTDNCPINGDWSDWSVWVSCSVTCGGGTQTRMRECNNPAPQYGGLYCSGTNITYQSCGGEPCPVQGGWSSWQLWTDCSSSCGGGTQQRQRLCDNPIPLYGGSNCSGSTQEVRICGEQSCAVDGQWSGWATWTECTTSCGSGSQSRSRDCNDPEPRNGGRYCDGTQQVYKTCGNTPCPVPGGWSEWSGWGACSSTCGEGIQLRERDCVDPPPQYGGAECGLNDTQRRDCFLTECQIDGGWSSWQEWGQCSSTCGWSVQTRSRDCDNPTPQYNGDDCQGKKNDTKSCILQRCPVDGMWSAWREWTPCSSTCSYGSRERSRNCSEPAPAFGGADCTGLKSDTKTCYDRECPQHGDWTKWTLWSSCTLTCGGGRKQRLRFCTNPSPRYNGSYCLGNGTHNQLCNIMDCPEIVALVAAEEIKPVEAPGAVSIGMIGVGFCGVLLAFVVVLDLATLPRHFSYLKRNLLHFKQNVWKRGSRGSQYEERSATTSGSNGNNVNIEETQVAAASNHCTNAAFLENESETTFKYEEEKFGENHPSTDTMENDVTRPEDINLEEGSKNYTANQKNVDLNHVHKRKPINGSGFTKL